MPVFLMPGLDFSAVDHLGEFAVMDDQDCFATG